jgi:hypothetical protein
MFEFMYELYIQGLTFSRRMDIGKYPSRFLPNLSRTGVPKTCMTLIGDLDCMDIFLCYADVAHKETQLLIQSSLCEKVVVAQLEDRLL